MNEFYIDRLINKNDKGIAAYGEKNIEFQEICKIVKFELDEDWNRTKEQFKISKLEREKRAIIGYEKETEYYKEKIQEIIRIKNLNNSWYPIWYVNLYDAIFNELFGLAGLAPWAYNTISIYENSSSAKVIGDRIYCLIDGKTVLQPQKINYKRRKQLMRALLLESPFEDTNKGFHEVYLHNGIRITIYSGQKTKEGEEIIVLRKYVIRNMDFNELVRLNTIPKEAVRIFEWMIKIGFNVIFAGPVRSGKTTFMQNWQMHEDKNLEGLVLATDPETPWHKLMPEYPIMQLIADGDELETITKSILRGDNDYVLLEEMRDAVAYNLALEITSIGTKRCKATIHDNNAYNIPYKMASKIRAKYGGNMRDIIGQIFMNFDIVIELNQRNDNRSFKRMLSIKEYYYDEINDMAVINTICEYDEALNKWRWNKKIYNKVRSNERYIEELQMELSKLNGERPLEKSVLAPGYYRSSED
ncbi:MAG TPA: ATPase, T2SS/T4P/T4SS family [Anaerovoracaceae bacterium]|nr:ATPase, T2SS/T4P/T4SS family [Anaerovoracaceae bacterium]